MAGQSGGEVPGALRFRNYAPRGLEEAVQAPPAVVQGFEQDAAAPTPVGSTEEVLVNVAPKKPNWDLRRDIADKLTRLERRTQAAMIKLMQRDGLQPRAAEDA